MANQFLTLALFIMLLSFFIILNSMATYDVDKAKPAMDSLSIAFSTREIEDNIAQSTIREKQHSINEGSAIDRMKALFTSTISGFEAQENRFGTEMYAMVPLKQFESAMKNLGQGKYSANTGKKTAADKFLPLLVSILKSENTQAPYRMDILLNVDKNPAELQNKEPDKLKNAIQKVTMFSSILEQSGLPKKLVSAGLEEGEVGYVALAFRPYAPYIPVSRKKRGAQ